MFKAPPLRMVAIAPLLLTACAPEDLPDDGIMAAGGVTISATATYNLIGVQSGKCVEVQGGSTANLAPLQIATCNGTTRQQFRIESQGSGFYRLRNVNSSLCADVSGASTTAGAGVIQWACGTGANQQWSFTDLASGAERLTVRHSGQVLDVTGNSTADGTLLEQWPSNGGANQQFKLQAVGSTSSGSGGSTGAGGTTGTGGTTGAGGTAGGCSATSSPVARHGQLRIQNGKLVNQCGRPVQLTSMSMYDWSQQGRQFYNATAVRNLLQDRKTASLRIPLLASNWPTQYPRMKTVMDACVANGIYCIPNWHVIGGSDVNAAKAFYVQLAKDYGNTPNIIYEPWNEPTSSSWNDIKSYMQQIIAAVRPIDPDGIFLSGDRQWDQRPDEACANPISDSNVGYVFHFYAASHSLAGFQGSLTSCLNANKLLWSTEYGGCESSGSGALNETEVRRWWAFMDANNISSNAWALETNSETSSVFVGNASSTGPWPDSQLTYWGKIVFAHIADRYAVTMRQ